MLSDHLIYRTEEHLVRDLCNALVSQDTEWGQVNLVREFDYKRGRTDVVAIDRNRNVLAFEAKLTKWREALQQAYRNTCYAHISYIVVPKETAQKAEKYHREFARRSVGLCYTEKGVLVVCLPAKRQIPIQMWLSNAAIVSAGG